MMLVVLSSVAGSAQEPAPKAAVPRRTHALQDGKAETSYAVGMNLGRAIRKDAELDIEIVVEGLRDAFSGGETLLTDAEVRDILNRLAVDLKTRQAAKLGEKGAAFLADNKSKEGVVSLESGLQYKVLKAGSGKRPTIRRLGRLPLSGDAD